MADPDPIEAGLEKTRLELEALAERLSPTLPETAPEVPASLLDSDDAKGAALVLTDLLGEAIRGAVFAERPPRTPGTQRRSRFTSPTPPAIIAPPPPATVAVPAPVPVESRPQG